MNRQHTSPHAGLTLNKCFVFLLRFTLTTCKGVIVFVCFLIDHQRTSHVDMSLPPPRPALLHHQEYRAHPRLWNIPHQNLELQQKSQCWCFIFSFDYSFSGSIILIFHFIVQAHKSYMIVNCNWWGLYRCGLIRGLVVFKQWLTELPVSLSKCRTVRD